MIERSRNIINSVLSVLIFIIANLLFSCMESVDLEHVDDPNSQFYLLNEGEPSCQQRINANSAQICWDWTAESLELLDFTEYLSIHRHSDNGQHDSVFTVAFANIDTSCFMNQDTVIAWCWIDSNLVLEHDYEYWLFIENEVGITKDTIKISYRHGFNQLDIEVDSISIYQNRSDTSITCKWKRRSDDLANIWKLEWFLADSPLAQQIIDTNIITLTSNLIHPADTTILRFYYGYCANGDTVWQSEPHSQSYVIQFDAVNDLWAVPFQSNVNRITWRYDSTKVDPDGFVVYRDNDSIGVVTVNPNNPYNSTQQILGSSYFVFYDFDLDVGSDIISYTIKPKTFQNYGDTISVNCSPYPQIPDDIIDDRAFTFVDEIYDSTGFYMYNYEFSEKELALAIESNYITENTLVYHSEYDSKPSLSSDLPVKFVDWELADTVSKSLGFSLPDSQEWVLAARASSNDSRQYAWGNSAPVKDQNCNYDTDHTVDVSSLPPSRVKVNWHNGIQGPYHLCGNVPEWTQTISASRQNAYVVKGGAWFDLFPEDLQIKRYVEYPQDEHIGGIRLIWKLEN